MKELLTESKNVKKLTDEELADGIMLGYLINYPDDPYDGLSSEEQRRVIMEEWSREDREWEFIDEFQSIYGDDE